MIKAPDIVNSMSMPMLKSALASNARHPPAQLLAKPVSRNNMPATTATAAATPTALTTAGGAEVEAYDEGEEGDGGETGEGVACEAGNCDGDGH